jgi:hypothetical protein
MIKRFLSLINSQGEEQKQIDHYRSLMRHEAQLGGQVFGPIPADRRREFFCLDKNTWIWHEEWTDHQTGQRHSKTTRYDVRPTGILKAQSNGSYHAVDPQEARNLVGAARIYIQRSLSELYGVRV